MQKTRITFGYSEVFLIQKEHFIFGSSAYANHAGKNTDCV